MANLDPINPESAPELEPVFDRMRAVLGFVPNSVLTMARVPGLGAAFTGLAGPILRNDLLEPELVQMVALAARMAVNCPNCLDGHVKKALKDGATRVVLFFLIAFLITAVLVYLYSQSLKLTIVPLVSRSSRCTA